MMISRNFKKFDWVLLGVIILLISIGLTLIYSVALSKVDNLNQSVGRLSEMINFQKQILFAGIGLVWLIFLSLIDYRIFTKYGKFFYLAGVLLLVLVLIFGATIRGSRSWFTFLGFNFQPVEVVKFISVIILAHYFSRQSRPLGRWKQIISSGLLIFLFFGLTIIQPDLGSAMLLFLLWFGFIVIIGLNRYQWLAIGLLGLIGGSVLWWGVLATYQKERIFLFLNPSADPLGRGYNITQSIIAVGSGRLLGRGLGLGSQSQLKFLPEAQTDFIFAVLSEELGLLGVAVLFLLLIILLWQIIKIARNCRDDFALFTTLGIMLFFFIQTVLNIAVNIGLAPVTGVTLPFVSYGGSSLLISMSMVGVLESIKMRS